MTAVARVLPRDWDGRRLLRFLAGLAMLALAFTAPAFAADPPPPAPIAVSSSITVGEAQTPPVTLSDSPSATFPVRAETATVVSQEAPLLVAGSLAAVLIGLWPGVRGERAPPPA
ncbi:hypothetical protein [Paractinoplanes globisporus]|uniref:Uncharacterized protein n=1 Tax=Paractinoplanes globisporus TaxID=113565 RepID=A0ABW6WNE7_9ACTN|nr:hypothetical protein [Actinoplanes globisporus]